MIVALPFPATLQDLMKVEGKAELIGGRIVEPMASGILPSALAFEIALELRTFAKASKVGHAFPDGIGYAMPYPLMNGRESFSPDASSKTGRNRAAGCSTTEARDWKRRNICSVPPYCSVACKPGPSRADSPNC